MNRSLARIGLVLGGCLLGLLAAEGALRVAYGTLPSIAAIRDRDWAVEKTTWTGGEAGGSSAPHDAGCNGENEPPLDRRTTLFGEARGGEPATLWIAGDSFTEGSGDEEGGGYALRLGAAVSEALDRPVHFVRFGHSGGNYCTWTEELRWALGQGLAPDLLVLQLFADDLENHTMLAVGGKLVRFPHTERDARLRFLVQRSYLANLLWFAAGIRSGHTSERLIHQRSQLELVQTLRWLQDELRARGADTVVFQVDPTGAALCPADPQPGSRCAHLVDDGNLIAGLARDSGLPFLDLRELWGDDGTYAWQIEREQMAAGQIDMVIHPNARGHALLAEALLPEVTERLR